MFEIERSYSCVPNKRRWVGVIIIGGGWKISKIQIAGVGLNFPGGLKNEKIQFLCRKRYKLFNVYWLQSKENKGKE